MRTLGISTALTAACLLWLSADLRAGEGAPPFDGFGSEPCEDCAYCGWLCRRHCHDGCRGRGDLGFNCGCNGSYKFPVPPLSTYHWPGMYSAQLMTDYHSPWRFPPLKPYTDELPPEVLGSATTSVRGVQPVTAMSDAARPAPPRSFSSQLETLLR